MFVKMEVWVEVPYGYYCNNCVHCEMSPYSNTEERYCAISGLSLDKAKNGRDLKTDDCFRATKRQLINGG